MLRLNDPNSASFKNLCCLRAVVDNTSNPDPLTQGLLIPAAPASQIKLPLTIIENPGLGICTPFISDPDNDINLQIDQIQLQAGEYNISVNLAILGTDATPFKIMQILLLGQQIFAAPPVVFAASQTPITLPPGPYTSAWDLCGSANFKISGTEIIICALILNNTVDDNVITLNSNVSIIKIN